MLESDRKELERNIYNREANMDRPAYHTFWDTQIYKAMHTQAYDPDLEKLGAKYLTGRKVLVLGAGRNEVRFALQFTDNVHALNISERIVAELAELFPTINSFVGDAENLARTETYDVVLCKSILHHLQPISAVLEGIHRTLNSGGHLFIAAEPGLLNPFAAAARAISPSQEHTPGEQPFVFSRLHSLLEKNFVTEAEETYFIVAMLLPYLARKWPRSRGLAGALLEPTLRVEQLACKLPVLKDLCWVIAGVYRAR